MKKKTSEYLEIAKSLIADENHWTKHYSQIEKNGVICYCTIGAVYQCYQADRFDEYNDFIVDNFVSPFVEIKSKLMITDKFRNSGSKSIFNFNDDPATTHTDVMELFDEAIALTKRLESE